MIASVAYSRGMEAAAGTWATLLNCYVATSMAPYKSVGQKDERSRACARYSSLFADSFIPDTLANT